MSQEMLTCASCRGGHPLAFSDALVPPPYMVARLKRIDGRDEMTIVVVKTSGVCQRGAKDLRKKGLKLIPMGEAIRRFRAKQELRRAGAHWCNGNKCFRVLDKSELMLPNVEYLKKKQVLFGQLPAWAYCSECAEDVEAERGVMFCPYNDVVAQLTCPPTIPTSSGTP